MAIGVCNNYDGALEANMLSIFLHGVYVATNVMLQGAILNTEKNYSETCANGHLYSETTCIKRPLCEVPKVSAQ